MSDEKPTSLAAAYFLAQGSCGTARELSRRASLMNHGLSEAFADEILRLASNFERVAEILKEHGYDERV